VISFNSEKHHKEASYENPVPQKNERVLVAWQVIVIVFCDLIKDRGHIVTQNNTSVYQSTLFDVFLGKLNFYKFVALLFEGSLSDVNSSSNRSGGRHSVVAVKISYSDFLLHGLLVDFLSERAWRAVAIVFVSMRLHQYLKCHFDVIDCSAKRADT